MKQDNLDHIMSEDQEILPSSGFAASVMDAVRSEAAAPPPIPFPWKRVLPGFAAAAFVLVAMLVRFAQFVHHAAVSQSPSQLPPAAILIFEAARTVGAGWILLALLLTFAAMMFSGS